MIISDATALIALINIDKFPLFEAFTDHLIITPEVFDEVTARLEAASFLDTVIKTGYVSVRKYNNRQLFEELNILLDTGESSSIVLAKEMDLPLMIDEKKGRRTAQAMGIEVIGLIGMVRFLYQNQTLSCDQTESLLQALVKNGFWISPQLIRIVLK